MPDAQFHLHRVDVRDAPGLFDLSDIHVAEADLFDEAVTFQRCERANARRERCAWVGRVKLIQMDSLDVERAPARLACGADVTASPVCDPVSLRPRQAAFCGDPDARVVPAPGRERLRDEPLVVADLAGVPAVGVGGVEEGDAAVEPGMQDGNRARLVPIALGGKAHTAHSDEWHEGASVP